MNTPRIRSILAIVAVVAIAVVAHAGDDLGLPRGDANALGMSSEKLAAIPGKLQGFVDKGQLPGFVTVVARQGKIVHFEAFGSMDVARDKPMRPDTIFRMYSMTKPITGVSVMILVDEGKVALSDPVSKYIPEFADAKVFVEEKDGEILTEDAKTPMTVKHLMMHTGGLTYPGPGHPVAALYLKSGASSDGGSGLSLEEFSKKVAEMPLLFQPGTDWNYGVSMDVLGRVVEVASGQRFAEFLQDRVFGPLGMKDSAFHVPAEKLDRFAANYGPEGDGMRLIDDPATSRYLKIPSQDSGGGGMVGTAADYLRFAQALLNGGELGGVRIISEKSAHEMTTNQFGPEFGDAPLKLFPGIDFSGIGFGYCGAVVMDGHGTTLFGPSGVYSWGGAASTDFWIDKNEGLVGIVLTQLIPTATYPTRSIMQNAVYDAIVQSHAGGTGS